MNKRKILLWSLFGLAFLLLVGPFLVPVPPLEDVRPVTELAGPDSEFLELNGVNLHLKTAGAGEDLFILLHGFGGGISQDKRTHFRKWN